MQDLLNHLNPWLVGLLSLLGTLVTLASVACKFVPKDSPWAPWLAWFATMPIGHAPSKPLPKVDPPTTGTVLALVAFGAMQLCQGCSLEAARNRRAARSSFDEATVMLASNAKRPAAQCQAWDNIHIWGDWSGGIAGGLGATATGLALATEDKTRTALTTTGLVLGAASTAAFVFADQSAASWAENCQ